MTLIKIQEWEEVEYFWLFVSSTVKHLQKNTVFSCENIIIKLNVVQAYLSPDKMFCGTLV